MTPEEKLASRLLARHQLQPPYDLADLVCQYAEIYYKIFPIDADGMSVGLKKSGKPQIYINTSRRHEVRQRFTLAHELGHVLIPWHTGNIVSHTNLSYIDKGLDSDFGLNPVDNFPYRQIEAEANRFAAELLLPKTWLSKKFIGVNIDDFGEISEEIIRKSRVSKDTFFIKLFNSLSSGYACVEIDKKNRVLNSFASKVSPVYKLPLGLDCSDSEPYPIYRKQRNFSLGNRSYIFWSFEKSMTIPEDSDPRSWRSILDKILTDTDLQDKRQSINATLPSMFQCHKDKEDSEIFSLVLHRYSERIDLGPFINHPLSQVYISKRLQELRIKYRRKDAFQ